MAKTNDKGNIYDRVLKEQAASSFIPFVLQRLQQTTGKTFTVIEQKESKFQTTVEREMDIVLLVEDEESNRFLLHIEFQRLPDATMPLRLSEYHGIALRQYGIEIIHLVIHLGENLNLPAYQELPENLQFKGFYNLNLIDIDAETMLASDIPEQVVLAILCNFKGKNPLTIIKSIVRKLQRVCESDTELKKAIQQLRVLSKVRNLRTLVTKNTNIMSIQIDVTDDTLYLMGEQRGITQGIAQGDSQGFARAKAEEKKKIEAAKRLAIIRLLKMRKLTVSEIAKVQGVKTQYVKDIKTELGL